MVVFYTVTWYTVAVLRPGCIPSLGWLCARPARLTFFNSANSFEAARGQLRVC